MRKRIGIGLGLVVILLGGVIFLLWPWEGEEPKENGRTNILVLGLDEVEGINRSDTIMLVSIKEDVKVISIPRDLRVRFPDGRLQRINVAYPEGGAVFSAKVLSNFLGIPIHFYVAVDYEGFKKLIDLIGGVTITVEKELNYVDEAQGLRIHIPPGKQHLTGKEALDYVRFRDETGDWGRIKRQQKLIRALLEQGISFQNELIQAAINYVNTNLSLVNMYDLAQKLSELGIEGVQMVQLPAFPVVINGAHYLEPDIVGTKELTLELIKEIEVLTRWDVKVGVLNGNGIAGLARRVGEYLRGEGFQVVHIGNADHFNYEKSYLVNLTGDGRKAEVLRRVLEEKLGVEAEIEVVTPKELEENLARIRERGYQYQEGTDLLFIFGKGFNLD